MLLDRVEVMPSTIVVTQRLSYDGADERYAECTEDQEPELYALLRVSER